MFTASMIAEAKAGVDDSRPRGRKRVFIAARTTPINPIVPPLPLPPAIRQPPGRSSSAPSDKPLPSIEAASAKYPASARQSSERWSRVTNNVRNQSSSVWAYDPVLGFSNETERFRTGVAAQEETMRCMRERNKKEKFWNARNEHWKRMDEERWTKLRADDIKHSQRDEFRRGLSRLGQSGVAYDLFTTQYARGPRGQDLKQRDSTTKMHMEHRSRQLRLNSCSYDPICGQDIAVTLNERN